VTAPILGVPYVAMEPGERVTGGVVFLKHDYVMLLEGDAMPNVYKIAHRDGTNVTTGRRSFWLTLCARAAWWLLSIWQEVRRIGEVWP
jgi:hypothetical protein